MQKTLFLIFMIGLVICVIPENTIAKDTQDWHLQHLPDGVRARIGKGKIKGNIAISDDGKRLAVASGIGIWVYDTETDQPLDLITGHTHWVTSVAFSTDGSLLASGSVDNTVRLWDAHTGTELHTMQRHVHSILTVAFSPDSSLLASAGADGTIQLWDVETGTHLRTLIGHLRFVYCVAFSPDDKILASGGEDRIIQFWDVETGESIRVLAAHKGGVRSIAFSPGFGVIRKSNNSPPNLTTIQSYTNNTLHRRKHQ